MKNGVQEYIFRKKKMLNSYKRMINRRLSKIDGKKKTIFLFIFYLMTFFAQNFFT